MPRINSYFRRGRRHVQAKSTATHKTKRKELYGARWQRESKRFLLEYPLCAYCEDRGVVQQAEVVDHIKPHGGDFELFWDMRNWQRLCKVCHNRKSASENAGGGVRPSYRPHWMGLSKIPVTLVVGPPGSGRRQYVRDRMETGELVVDFPALLYETGDERRAVSARNVLLGRLSGPHALSHDRAWWIDSMPSAKERRWWTRKFGCRVVVLNRSLAGCREALAGSGREDEIAACESWHKLYTVDFSDEELRYE